MQQRLIFNLLAVAQAGRAHPDQVEKVVREVVLRAGGIGDREARTFATPGRRARWRDG